jgi:hypothetical protein
MVFNGVSLWVDQLAGRIRLEGLQWSAAGFSDIGDFCH